ncbi:hypothetical protein EYF80_038407 [Liparis tanakae]|uniref:Uncharacterized protein n=1 Tax=Liparis tanakae TaxID=230148 RepID=A0A4Z2GDM7_9TELE|nr:hypothetical protein EYF80_038407 [Liparis tanakae]
MSSCQLFLMPEEEGGPAVGMDPTPLASFSEAQGGVGSLDGAGVDLARRVEVGSTWRATGHGPERAAQTCSGSTEQSCGDKIRGVGRQTGQSCRVQFFQWEMICLDDAQ